MYAKCDETLKILFVDDELPVLKSLQRFARSKQWTTASAASGDEGLEILGHDEFDIVVSDMRMPGMSGAEFLAEVKARYPATIRILLTGYADFQALEQAINTAGIFNYLAKPWDEFLLAEIVERAFAYLKSERERERLEALTHEQNKKLAHLARSLDGKVRERTIEIEQALTLLHDVHDRSTHKFVESLKVVNQVLDWKEGWDAGHNRFVAEYAERLGRRLKMNKVDMENTRIAASLHRIGALGLQDQIREKPQWAFNAEEKKQFADVAVMGELALSGTPGLKEVAKIIRHQNEWVNGNGFPDKLIDREIPMGSKILHVVSDFYDVFNGRVEEFIQGVDGAIEYIKKWAGKKYDTALVEMLVVELAGFNQADYESQPCQSSDLVEGMILDSDIVSKKGMLLLSRGTVLTGLNIATLKDYEHKLKEQFQLHVRIPVAGATQ